jgi:hypothetical protein
MDPTTQRLMMSSDNKQPFFSSISYPASSIFVPTAFKLDSTGNAYICGWTNTPNKAILIKLRLGISGGAVEWARSITTAGNEQYSDVAISSDGNAIYVVGIFSGNAGLAKYNSSGTLQWSRYLASTNAYQSVTVDSAGDVYITGYVIKSGDTEQNVFNAKYNSSGTLQWQRYEQYYDATFNSYGTSIVSVPSSGGFVITGYVEQSGLVPDILITKFTTTGTVSWKRIISTTSNEYGRSIGIDSAGDVYVLGDTDGQGAGSTDIYLIKVGGTNGLTTWQRSLGSLGGENGTKLHVDPSTGDCYIVGDTTGLIIIAKYNSSGTLQWQRSISTGGGGVSVSGISLGPDKMLYVMFRNQGLISDFYFIRIDPNGNGTGTFSTITYATTSYTDSARTLANAADVVVGGTTAFTEADASGVITEASESVTISGL